MAGSPARTAPSAWERGNPASCAIGAARGATQRRVRGHGRQPGTAAPSARRKPTEIEDAQKPTKPCPPEEEGGRDSVLHSRHTQPLLPSPAQADHGCGRSAAVEHAEELCRGIHGWRMCEAEEGVAHRWESRGREGMREGEGKKVADGGVEYDAPRRHGAEDTVGAGEVPAAL